MVFTGVLLRLDFSSLSVAAYNCLEKFFTHINSDYGLLCKSDLDPPLEVYDINLIGIEAL